MIFLYKEIYQQIYVSDEIAKKKTIHKKKNQQYSHAYTNDKSSHASTGKAPNKSHAIVSKKYIYVSKSTTDFTISIQHSKNIFKHI